MFDTAHSSTHSDSVKAHDAIKKSSGELEILIAEKECEDFFVSCMNIDRGCRST